MNIAFETIIDRYLSEKVGRTEGFLSVALAQKLHNKLVILHDQALLKSAGIGQQSQLAVNRAIRSDKILWLDRSHNDEDENEFLDLIEDFISYLNATCYAGISGYEFHYAYYDAGSFYKRHLDQFSHDSGRAFSMITYLNHEWKEEDGGHLCIFQEPENVFIAPINTSCVFFKSSELEHEVMICHRPRLSITGWLKTN